jgi:hypothetical protein
MSLFLKHNHPMVLHLPQLPYSLKTLLGFSDGWRYRIDIWRDRILNP